MKFLVAHRPHVTIFSDFLFSLIPVFSPREISCGAILLKT